MPEKARKFELFSKFETRPDFQIWLAILKNLKTPKFPTTCFTIWMVRGEAIRQTSP